MSRDIGPNHNTASEVGAVPTIIEQSRIDATSEGVVKGAKGVVV